MVCLHSQPGPFQIQPPQETASPFQVMSIDRQLSGLKAAHRVNHREWKSSSTSPSVNPVCCLYGSNFGPSLRRHCKPNGGPKQAVLSANMSYSCIKRAERSCGHSFIQPTFVEQPLSAGQSFWCWRFGGELDLALLQQPGQLGEALESQGDQGRPGCLNFASEPHVRPGSILNRGCLV